jgi:heterodisulfide reductase subunit A-like polyferredoxin
MVHTVNLRGEVLRLVAKDSDLALKRFTGLLERSINHCAKLLPFPAPARNYNFTTAVIGRSEAAVTTAMTMAEAGHEVLMFGTDRSPLSEPLPHANIHSFMDATVTAVEGTVGHFTIETRSADGYRTFTVGSVVIGDKNRKVSLYRQANGRSGFKVHSIMQKDGVDGIPFIYPGATSISGLFLADPPGVQISKRAKGAAAAVLAAAVMPQGPRQSRGFSAVVNQTWCRSCGRCHAICPYQAITLQPNDVGGYCAMVDDALCKGCGNCISVCPCDAADSPYRDQHYLEQTVESLLVGPNARRP